MKQDEDPRDLNSDWEFHKEIKTPVEQSWDEVLQLYNSLQTENLDLYAEISDLEHSWFDEKRWGFRHWLKSEDSWQYTLTFENERVYEWYKGLAVELDVGLWKAVKMVLEDREEVMDMLGLEGSRSLVISSVDVDKGGNTVSKDELEDIVEAEKAEEIVSTKDDEGLEEQGFRDDEFPNDVKG